MNSFGANPVCPRCSKLVYAAEQVMGPGRKLYHKPCLACTACNKRLDSFTLLEHDEQPYCKTCHLKHFGTRDLRHANLPHAQRPRTSSTEDLSNSSPTSSPTRTPFSPAPLRPTSTGSNPTTYSPIPRLPHTHTLTTSPTSPPFQRSNVNPGSTSDSGSTPDARGVIAEEAEVDGDTNMDSQDLEEPTFITLSYPSNTGRPGFGTIPRTIPLGIDLYSRAEFNHKPPQSLGSTATNSSPAASLWMVPTSSAASLLDQEGGSPLRQTPTGTRYGAALGGGSVGVHMTGTGNGSPRRWGGGTPLCPRCSKSVYFAEQVKAVGKTFHKNCLRCNECGSSLDSNRLRDHDGEPFCVRCYNKLFGPQGAGYALLGKAGG